MTNIEKKYHRKEIAKAQLKTAILLFLNGKDLSSVITLAGAAANILSQLVRNVGNEPFIDYARRIYEHSNPGKTPPREKYNHHIEKLLGISVHKHMSEKCTKTITLDLQQCAIDALTRAICDYVSLYGQEENFIKSFLKWTYQNTNSPEIMKLYASIPGKLKK